MIHELFGTDGIRGRVGKSPFDHKTLTAIGHAIARWAFHKYGATPTILVGQDTRASADWVMASLSGSLLRYPISITQVHVMPTPALCRLLQESSFNCALMISASHNPAHDNGIKLIDRLTGKLSRDDEQYIINQMAHEQDPGYAEFGRSYQWATGEQQYIESIAPFFDPNFLQGLRIGLDCAHGATYRLAPTIFKQFGATVFAINTEPDGHNINQQCGSQHTQQLQKLVLEKKLSAGFAFDGDGDRVIAVNKDGVIKDGDDMLALLMAHTRYKDQPTVVGTVMSNVGFDRLVKANNKQLVRTPVGDKYIASYLQEHNLLLGGEQSGHIIMRDYLPTGDGIVTALRLLEAALMTNNLTLSTFEHFPQLIVNVPVQVKRDLSTPEIAQIIDEHKKLLNGGRLVVRYSGTENLLRIMVEDQTESSTRQICTSLSSALKNHL